MALQTHLIAEAAVPVVTDPQHPRWLGAINGSNNTAQLTAIREAAVWAYHTARVHAVDFRYDSEYAAALAAGKNLPSSNVALANTVRAAIRQLQSRKPVTFTHIKAHRGEIWNEHVDSVADYGKSMFQPPA